MAILWMTTVARPRSQRPECIPHVRASGVSANRAAPHQGLGHGATCLLRMEHGPPHLAHVSKAFRHGTGKTDAQHTHAPITPWAQGDCANHCCNAVNAARSRLLAWCYPVGHSMFHLTARGEGDKGSTT